MFPKQELLAFYEKRLLLDILTLDSGFLMLKAKPFASRQRAFTMCKALVVFLPQMDDIMAIKWNVKTEYVAVSEILVETSLVKLDKNIDSSKYRICYEALSTKPKTRHASLYFS